MQIFVKILVNFAETKYMQLIFFNFKHHQNIQQRSRWIFSVLILLSMFLHTGCERKKSSRNNKKNDVVVTNTIDVKRIVSTGESLSFNNMTGGANSVAVNPVTHLPAVAYYDKNINVANTVAVGALKFAQMDANGAWNIEVIDANYGTVACGTANSYCVGAPNAANSNNSDIISIDFKSDGTPAIAYVYGASANTVGGFKQIRLAEKNISTGIWTINTAYQSPTAAAATNVAVANTIDPMKALRLKFDQNNIPHIIFSMYTQTITNSKIKYLFRNSSSVWNVSDVTSAVSAGTITALGQGMSQAGLAICGSSGPVLSGFQVSAAAGVGKTIYANCTATSDGGCSSWNVINVQNGCGGASCFSSGVTAASNAGSFSDVIIDVSGKPVLGIYSTATPNTSLFTGTIPQTCNTNPAAAAGSWGAMSAVGAASEGSLGFSMAASASQYFISYLKSTTSAMINSCTIGSCTWLATGTTLETTTVNREGVELAYDSYNDTLYSTYAKIPAGAVGAIGNDIMLAMGSPADITNNGTYAFSLTLIDNLVNVFPITTVPLLSAARAPNGLIGYTYFFQDTTAADSKLYFGIKGGPPLSPAFSAHTVTSHMDSGAAPNFVGSYPSLVFDANSNPAIAYYNGSTKSLDLARSANSGTSFNIVTIDDHASNDLGQYPNVKIWNSSTAIAYYDATNTALKFARSQGGGSWKISSIDGLTGSACGNNAADAGKYAKVAITSTGQVALAYQMDGKLRLALSGQSVESASALTWSCITLDDSGNTRGSGIGISVSAQNIPHLVHFDSTSGQIRYLTCANELASCFANPASFTVELLDAIGTTSLIGTIPSIEVTSTNKVYISFYSQAYQSISLAIKDPLTNTWAIERLEMPSSGAYTGVAGLFSALLLNGSELPTLFYRSNENWIKYLSREIQ